MALFSTAGTAVLFGETHTNPAELVGYGWLIGACLGGALQYVVMRGGRGPVAAV
ncbi:MAG TPA: hypothetical protein H9906_05330 [Candidatus Paenalcaligenes intestinipullorum]|uniref:Uncharacterized protein n=1 Tax=Candidatus Paenalcaligenes intestinipullorum TaxID=2838718 RepID=A0A9D2RJX9_9BURK|nr:hypothetical protein [Candidatus Paenalcaligenes intestinipullorum]